MQKKEERRNILGNEKMAGIVANYLQAKRITCEPTEEEHISQYKSDPREDRVRQLNLPIDANYAMNAGSLLSES